MPKTFPLIHSPSWLARKHTTRATSIGRPTLWRGDHVAAYYFGSALRSNMKKKVGHTSSTPSSLNFSPLGMYSRQTLWYMSVLIPPGAMQLTVIFLSPKSIAMHRTKVSMAPLLPVQEVSRRSRSHNAHFAYQSRQCALGHP